MSYIADNLLLNDVKCIQDRCAEKKPGGKNDGGKKAWWKK